MIRQCWLLLFWLSFHLYCTLSELPPVATAVVCCGIFALNRRSNNRGVFPTTRSSNCTDVVYTVYLQDTCRMAAPESRCGLEVQQTSVQNRPIFFARSRSSLVLKPFTVFACHRMIIQRIPLGHHSTREKELSNILSAPTFNRLQ